MSYLRHFARLFSDLLAFAREHKVWWMVPLVLLLLLIAGLARRCVAEGLPRLAWWVLNWNESSRVFYRALGAKAQDEWTVKRMEGEALAKLGAEA